MEEKKIEFLKSALQRIAAYQIPEELRENSEEDWGLNYTEALEAAYENVLFEAKGALLNYEVMVHELSKKEDSDE